MPREFYPAEFTTRSRSVLDHVIELVPAAVLIGGWATWVRTRGPMSHDIDLIVHHDELDALRTVSQDLSRSAHLGGRKWRATIEGIHLDLYVPFQSRLGQRLALRVEALEDQVDTVDTWRVLTVPAHVATKVAALLDRPDTMPGEKDRAEILELLPHTDAAAVIHVISQASEHSISELRGDLTDTLFDYLGETDGLGKQERTTLRHARSAWRAAVESVV